MTVKGKLAGQGLLQELRSWRFWAYVLALIPLAFLLILVRVGVFASYLSFPGGEVAYGVLALAGAGGLWSLRVFASHWRRMRHAANLAAPTRPRPYLPALAMVFCVQAFLGALTPVVVRHMLPSGIGRHEWARLVNRDARENLPFLPLTFH